MKNTLLLSILIITGCEEGVTECYYQGDLDVLQDIIDVNDSLIGEPLEIGSQYWNNGRLDSLYLFFDQLTSLPESIGNLSSLVLPCPHKLDQY